MTFQIHLLKTEQPVLQFLHQVAGTVYHVLVGEDSCDLVEESAMGDPRDSGSLASNFATLFDAWLVESFATKSQADGPLGNEDDEEVLVGNRQDPDLRGSPRTSSGPHRSKLSKQFANFFTFVKIEINLYIGYKWTGKTTSKWY